MVYDCFPFFNELDILEIRLNVLTNSVDYFVIIESTRTHQGKPKELYYLNNKERYVEFHPKVIHVISDTFPKENMSSWEYEQFQRNEIKRGLMKIKPDDIIIVSDVDEIPSPQGISKALQMGGFKIFQQKAYYNFLNCTASTNEVKRKYWNGPVMISFENYTSAQELRNLVIRSMKLNNVSLVKRIAHTIFFAIGNLFAFRRVTIVEDGGWHFTYMGGTQKIIEKLEAFAHTELNTDEGKDMDRIHSRINEGKSIFDNTIFEFVALDQSFPKYILDNQEKYAHLIKQDVNI